jgi:L,D-transpeptidase ErfK/SrfK
MRAIILGGLALTATATLAAPAGDMIGTVRTHIVAEADTLADLARDNGLGYVEIVGANPGVDPWLPGAGTRIVLPTGHLLPSAPRRGIVINIADQRLYFFPPGKPAQTYPIGVPAAGINLQTGTTRVIAKRTNPVWVPPPSVRAEDPELPRAVPPGPDNPLGSFALDLEWTNVVIHGTNRPYGIGRRVSHGCFRLYPKDIEALFKQVPIGTTVTVVDQPVKTGWVNGELYLEVHPTLEQADEIEATGRFTPAPIADLDRLVFEAAAPLVERIDWPAVNRAARERTGVPVRVFK